MKNIIAFIFTGLVAFSNPLRAGEVFPIGKEKWIFVSNNFATDKAVDDTIAMLKGAAKTGYTDAYISDCKFFRWNEKGLDPVHYTANLKKLRAACRELNIKVTIPVYSFSTDMLANDPNLAEGMPVVDAPFVARGGKLVPADEDCKLVNGDFETVKRPNHPDGWNAPFLFERYFIDTDVKAEGKQSLRIEGHNSMKQIIKVMPFRYYHLSLKVKTQGLKPTTNYFVSVASVNTSRQLFANGIAVTENQDWTPVDIAFNTMDSTEIAVAFGNYGPSAGKLWFDDVKIEPGGFVNLIRRQGAPLKITSDDGKTIYEENKDFANAIDPLLGNVDIAGIYRMWHKAPEVTIPAGSRITEGQIVRASYCHSMTTYGEATVPCFNEPKIWTLAEENLKHMKQVMEPDGYMIPHDEIRHMGYDDSCCKANLPMAKMLAENIKRCIAETRKEDPNKPIYVWSDMFDPLHNAQKTGLYFFVKGDGPWYGAWEGLDKDVIIMNWHGGDFAKPGERLEAMKFFAERGHKQILCGYYDAPVENITPWLKEAATLKGISGVMYTTWGNDYSQLEKFAQTVDGFKAAE
jgi:hypothetical protein